MSKRKDNLATSDESSPAQPTWFKSVESKIPTLQLFPHCKLGEGFAQYAIGSDTGCILIWPIYKETDVDEAAINLEKAKESLIGDEPCSEQIMVLVIHPERRIDASIFQSACKRECGQGC